MLCPVSRTCGRVTFRFVINSFLYNKFLVPPGSSVSPIPESCTNFARQYSHASGLSMAKDPKKITEEEWRKKLTPEQFYVCRQQGTERAHSGKYTKHFEKGMYVCICCGAELFSSEHKFSTPCGWPSFHTAYGAVKGDESKSNIVRKPDETHGMSRIEVRCKKCDAHLGHVFDDGPPPTGERFCINSVCLNFKAA